MAISVGPTADPGGATDDGSGTVCAKSFEAAEAVAAGAAIPISVTVLAASVTAALFREMLSARVEALVCLIS